MKKIFSNLKSNIPLILLTIVSLCFGKWKQEEFIIGSWLEPIFLGNDSADIATFTEYRDLGFNTLTASFTSYDPLKNWNSANQCLGGISKYSFFNNPGGADALYRLRILDSISGLKTFIFDRGLWGPDSALINVMITNYTTIDSSYTDAFRNLILGYHINRDEASPKCVSDTVLPTIDLIAAGDPDKTCLNNFGAIWRTWYESKGNINKRFQIYREFIRGYLENPNTDIISFDLYKFFKAVNRNGDTTWLCWGPSHPTFYRHLKIFAEECKRTSKALLGVPCCARHDILEFTRVDTNSSWQFAQRRIYPAITEELLRHEAFSPVIYGAKGIIWYAYNYHPNPSTGKYNIHVNSAGTHKSQETYYEYPSNNSQIRTWLSIINHELKNMGNILLKLNWITTIHGAKKDLILGEPDLPIITDAGNKIIKSVSSSSNISSLAIGIFTYSNVSYLMVMNKDIIDKHIYKIDLKNAAPGIWKHKKTEKKWVKVNGSNTFTLTLKPGDMELILLDNP